MDYKYINQLLERYWDCETTLEEEKILKTFFSQKDIPAELKAYQPLFLYETEETKTEVLGEEFDERLMSIINETKPVKAKVIPLQQRFKPLFKAAAVVAIILTLGNAVQMSLNSDEEAVAGQHVGGAHKGASVALSDSAVIDTIQHSNADVVAPPMGTMIK